MAGVLCFKSGARPHLVYRLGLWRGHKGERRGFTWAEYRDLIVATHNQLHAPMVWIWDNLNVRKAHELVEFIDASRDWLYVVRLPSYAPELNLTGGSLLNQYRPDVLDGCLAQTGLTLATTPRPRYWWRRRHHDQCRRSTGRSTCLITRRTDKCRISFSVNGINPAGAGAACSAAVVTAWNRCANNITDSFGSG